MSRTTRIMTVLFAAAVLALPCSLAMGDPLPGEVLKFQQMPMVKTPVGVTAAGEAAVYYGHDELSTAMAVPGTNQYQGVAMADDFADEFDTPVVHVRWWGSYLNEKENPDGYLRARKFLISFESDVPADPTTGGFSHPGQPLLSQIVTLGDLSPGSGTFKEKAIRGPDPLLSETLYEYNAELHCPFPQEKDTVYWLKIVALDDGLTPDNRIQWGWHNRDYTLSDALASPAVAPGEMQVGEFPSGEPIWHFQDDSVSSDVIVQAQDTPCDVFVEQFNYEPQRYVSPADGPSLIGQYSKDLAFELYTVPESSSLALLGGAFALMAVRRRRSKPHVA